MSALACTGCGTPGEGYGTSMPVPDRCEFCPPETCAECGGANHIASDQMCACWVSVETMPFADLKAALAGSGIGVDLDGKLST